MNIVPQENIVHLKIDRVKTHVVDASSRESAVEFAEVIAVGKGIESLKKGDKVFVKAWAVDIVSYKDTKYHFCNINTGGILAIVNDL